MCLRCKRQLSGITESGCNKALARSVLFLSNIRIRLGGKQEIYWLYKIWLQTGKLSICEAHYEVLNIKGPLSEQALLRILSLCILPPQNSTWSTVTLLLATFSPKGTSHHMNIHLPIFFLFGSGCRRTVHPVGKQDSAQFNMEHNSCHATWGESSCNT